jgi:hypothetical protein
MSKYKLFVLGAALLSSVPLLISSTSKKVSGKCTYYISHCISPPECGRYELIITKHKGELKKHLAHGDSYYEVCDTK